MLKKYRILIIQITCRNLSLLQPTQFFLWILFTWVSLGKICQNTDFLWPSFSAIRTEFTILRFCPYTGKCGTQKTCILAYFIIAFCSIFYPISKRPIFNNDSYANTVSKNRKWNIQVREKKNLVQKQEI